MPNKISITAKALFALVLLASAAAAQPLFLPAPQQAKLQGTETIQKIFTINAKGDVPSSTLLEWRTALKNRGFEQKDGGLTVNLSLAPIEECRKAGIPPYQRTNFLELPELQTYFLRTGGSAADVRACGEDGFFYALKTMNMLLTDAEESKAILQVSEIVDYPAFPVRAIFEGGYGIWDKDGRLALIDWMGSVKLNSYIYGPKSDPKIRRMWREPYSDVELFQFKRMVERGRKNHIQFGYVIAPTLGVEYGSEEDAAAIVRKLRPLQALGIKNFIVAFDDTLGMMYDPDDRKKFANLGEAESFLTNKVSEALQKFDPETVVVIVPEIYAGVHPMDYTKAIAQKLDKDVLVGWTGNQIGAPKLDLGDIQAFIDFYGKPPSFADNWGSLYPMIARGKDLYKKMTQFGMNPYNLQGELPVSGVKTYSEAELTVIQASSLSQMGWNPSAYDPDAIVNLVLDMYCTKEARELVRWIIYKDYFDFLAYYVLTTDYKTPHERKLDEAVKNKDSKALVTLAGETLPVIQQLAQRDGLPANSCPYMNMSGALERRAASYREWFGALAGPLEKIRAAAGSGSIPEEEIKSYLKTLRGEK